MSMIERVARAMYEASPFRETAGAYEDQSEIYRRTCRLFARAVIEAMREPTEAMLKAAWVSTRDVAPDERMRVDLMPTWQAHNIKMARLFTAMIDAALSEEG